jgi:hypothetical protein
MPFGYRRDIDAEVVRLERRRVDLSQRHRERPGDPQILLEDASGNPIELFQPAAA